MIDRDLDRLVAKALSARNQWVNANENVARLHNRGQPAGAIAAAEIRRERAGDAWEAAEAAVKAHRLAQEPAPTEEGDSAEAEITAAAVAATTRRRGP